MAKTRKTVPTVNVMQLIAASILAFKANGDKVEKNDLRFEEPSPLYPNGQAETTSNKTRIIALIDNGYQFNVEEMAAAREAVEKIQTSVTMNTLAGKKVNPFTLSVLAECEQEMAPKYKAGILAYVPSVVAAIDKAAVRTEQMAAVAQTSKPIGQYNDKVTISFNLIEKRWVERFGCFSAFGADENGNLVSFFTQHEDLCQTGKIVGKIKRVGPDSWRQGAIVSTLNYVKVVA